MRLYIGSFSDVIPWEPAVAHIQSLGHEVSFNKRLADIVLDCSKLTTRDEIVAHINGALIWDEIK